MPTPQGGRRPRGNHTCESQRPFGGQSLRVFALCTQAASFLSHRLPSGTPILITKVTPTPAAPNDLALLRAGLCPCVSCAGEWLCVHSLFSCQVTHMASMSLGTSTGSREARYIGFIGLCRDPFESGGRSLSTSTSTQEDNRRVLGFPPGVPLARCPRRRLPMCEGPRSRLLTSPLVSKGSARICHSAWEGGEKEAMPAGFRSLHPGCFILESQASFGRTHPS